MNGTKSKAISILKKLSLFQGLADHELFLVLQHCTSITLARGETLLHEGEKGSSMYVVLAGQLEISIVGSGIVHVMEPGEVLGEMSLVCNLPRSATARALGECALLSIEAEDLFAVFETNPRIGFLIMSNIANTLATRLNETNKRLLHGLGK